MDLNHHEKILEDILHPRAERAQEILENLGLARLPSREEVFDEIEKKLLLPKDKLPAHWLPTYQVSVFFFFSSDIELLK